MGAQPVIPLRVYEDMEAAQRFLVDVFGFKQGRLVRDPSGRPFHAEVHTGDSVIWIHRVDPEHGLVSARTLPAQPGGLVVPVDGIRVFPAGHCPPFEVRWTDWQSAGYHFFGLGYNLRIWTESNFCM